MRRPGGPNRLDLPRWRRKRNDDLRRIAGGYGAALAATASVTAAVCFLDGGLARRALDFTACVLMAFCGIIYLAAGGLVVARAAPRMAGWRGGPVTAAPWGWLRVLLWPLSVGGMLLRLATPYRA